MLLIIFAKHVGILWDSIVCAKGKVIGVYIWENERVY